MRLTIEDDLTTPTGLAKAIAAVSTPSAVVMLFGALPCTGGSQCQYLNWFQGDAKTRAKITQHRRIFRVLWRHFVQVAEMCLEWGGCIAFEWPRGCTYWRDRRVQSFMQRHSLAEVRFDGCMFGLKSHATKSMGKLTRKPWTIATSAPQLHRLCRGCTHQPHEHAPCALAERYMDDLVHTLHEAFAE